MNATDLLERIRRDRACTCGRSDGEHSHCARPGCDAVIPAGAFECAACADRYARARYCARCMAEFVPEMDAPAEFRARGFCSAACLDQKLQEWLADAGLPAKFHRATFSSFEALTPGLKSASEELRAWASIRQDAGLYLLGRPGAGKTHLAAATMSALLRRGVGVRFVSTRGFALECQSAFTRDETAAEIVDGLLEGARFLVLDDLGCERQTEFVRSCLLHLVDECYTREMVLIVTSNVEPDRLGAVDPRIASRLAEMCRVVRIEAPDYRRRIAAQCVGATPKRPSQ